MIIGIQSHGSLAHWHPHLHSIATAGAFTPEGLFLPLPEKLETEPFLRLWEKKVADFLWSEERITRQFSSQRRALGPLGFLDGQQGLSRGRG